MTLKVLQVCNVGQIVGGTAACAWTITRSLPRFEHTIAFPKPPGDATRRAFADCRVVGWDRITRQRVAGIDADIVILHNSSPSRVETSLPAVTIHYLHSRVSPVQADLTLYCSQWLANRCGGDSKQVCLQAVPRPLRPSDSETRSLRESPVIGRICTPQGRKWPAKISGFYEFLAKRFPQVQWEFVGCPKAFQTELRKACGGKAIFFPASWEMRSRLWQWDALLYHNPSVTESFGRTVAEAMRAGCIPIVDDRGGFTEQITESCGFLCQSPDDFAGAIDQILSPSRRVSISRTCRAHADEKFSLSRFRRDLIQRFHEAASVG